MNPSNKNKTGEKVIFIPMNKNFGEKYASVLTFLQQFDPNIEWVVMNYTKSDDKILFDEANKGKKLFILLIDTEERRENLRSRVFLQHTYSQSVVRLWNRIIACEENALNNFCFIINRGEKEDKLPSGVKQALQNLNEQNHFCVAECSDLSGVQQAIQSFVYEYYPHLKRVLEERKNPYIQHLKEVDNRYTGQIKSWIYDALSYVALSQKGFSMAEIQKLLDISAADAKEMLHKELRTICIEKRGCFAFSSEEYKSSFIKYVLSPMREREMRLHIIDYFKQFGCYSGSFEPAKASHYLLWKQFISFSGNVAETEVLKPLETYFFKLTKEDSQAQFLYTDRELQEVPYQYFLMDEWRRLYSYLLDLKAFVSIFEFDLNSLEKYWHSLMAGGFLLSGYLELSIGQKNKLLVAEGFNCLGIFSGYYFHQYALSLQFFNQSLEIYKEKYGDNDEKTLNTLSNIGSVYYLQEEHKEALSCFKRILQIKRTHYKDVNSPAFADVCVNIAMVYNAVGDYDSAILYCERVINIMEKHGVAGIISLENAYFVIAETYMLVGYYAEAIAWYRKAIQVSHDEEEDSDITYISNQLGNAYFENGDYAYALEIHTKTLNLRLNAEPKNDGNIAVSYYNLARVYYMQKEYGKAMQCLQEDRELSIGNPVSLALNQWWMIKCRMATENDDAYYRDVLDDICKTLKKLAPDLVERRISVYLTYVKCCLRLNDYDSAVNASYKAHELYKSRFGKKSHPLEAKMLEVKGDILLQVKFVDPLPAYQAAYRILQMFFGNDHAFTKRLLAKMKKVEAKQKEKE